MGEVEACRHSSGKAEPAASQVAIRRITQKKFARQPKRIETRGAMASSIAKLRHAFVFYRAGRWRRLRKRAETLMEGMGNSMGVNGLNAVRIRSWCDCPFADLVMDATSVFCWSTLEQ